MIVTLRTGPGLRPIFMVPGAGGRAYELQGLANKLAGDRPVICFEPFDPEATGHIPSTVEAMARQVVAGMRDLQPQGPYQIVGYSFGGLVALEASRQLKAAGSKIEFIGMIDTIYDYRFWPPSAFAAAQFARAFSHLSSLVRMPIGSALSELNVRARRLAKRLARRAGSTTIEATIVPANNKAACIAAIAQYQPQIFEGQVLLYASGGKQVLGSDTSLLWRDYLPELRTHRLPGEHLDLVRLKSALDYLAECLDKDLGLLSPK